MPFILKALVSKKEWEELKDKRNHKESFEFTTIEGKKVLSTHGSYNGTLIEEDQKVIQSNYDIIIACHPKKVYQYFFNKYFEFLPVYDDRYSGTIWSNYHYNDKTNIMTVVVGRSKAEIDNYLGVKTVKLKYEKRS